MRRCLILGFLFLGSACGHSKNKSEAKVDPVCLLPNRASLASWDQKDSPVVQQLHCIEGYLVRQDKTTASPDCTGATLSDTEKAYLKVFSSGTCPKDEVLKTCHTATGRIYLYRSNLSTDIEFFVKYCHLFTGKIS
jgi:hypothetical protein